MLFEVKDASALPREGEIEVEIVVIALFRVPTASRTFVASSSTFERSWNFEHNVHNMREKSLAVFRSAVRSAYPRAIGRRGAQYGVRWSSSERQWSTPLAKSLAEAITVNLFHHMHKS